MNSSEPELADSNSHACLDARLDAGDSPIRDWSIPALAEECIRQSAHFRKVGDFDERYFIELFRRAILQKNQDAWSVIVAQYRPLIAAWVRSCFYDTGLSIEDVIQDAFLRFLRTFTPNRFREQEHYRSIMAYLQRCAFAAALDYRRRTRNDYQQAVRSIDDYDGEPLVVTADNSVERLVQARLNANLVWQRVLAQCLSETDRLIARRIFVEGYRPEQVFLDNRERFSNVQVVYQHLRDLRDRLRNDVIVTEIDEC